VVVEQYAFVPARGGLLAVEGGLPRLPDEWTFGGVDGLPRFLRVAAHVEVEPGRALRLRVFEPSEEDGTPPARIAVPEPLRPAFEQALAELAGAPAPERRPAWSRPGWHEQAEAWAGMPLEQVRIWPLSAVLRNGDVWFKAVFPHFHHEPAITQALGSPRVLRADRERGWMLLEHVPGEPASDHHGALRALAAVHRAWVGRVDEALALGAHDRRAPAALPHTLVHGDFHAGNVLGSTILDWSDAAVANPLHDVNHYLLHREPRLRAELLATYAEARPDVVDVDVAAAAAACEAETYEYVAESYAGITDALAPDDRWWFEQEEARWLGFASDVRAGRRPNPDT
jgi:hypothetical protein